MVKLIAHLLLGGTFVISDSAALLPDLAFQLSCSQHANYESISSTIVDFLRQKDFDAVDLTKVRITVGRKSVFDQDIRAVRSDEVVSILKIGIAQQVHVALYSRPPTKHDEKLESELLQFFYDQVDCEISGQSRYDNSASSEAIFDRQLTGTRNLLREAREISH